MRKEPLDKGNLIWNLREIVQVEERNNWQKKKKKKLGRKNIGKMLWNFWEHFGDFFLWSGLCLPHLHKFITSLSRPPTPDRESLHNIRIHLDAVFLFPFPLLNSNIPMDVIQKAQYYGPCWKCCRKDKRRNTMDQIYSSWIIFLYIKRWLDLIPKIRTFFWMSTIFKCQTQPLYLGET